MIEAGVVPDGVAKVSYGYAAGGGFPARTVSSTVVNNVYVIKTPPNTHRFEFATSITAYAADGRRLRFGFP